MPKWVVVLLFIVVLGTGVVASTSTKFYEPLKVRLGGGMGLNFSSLYSGGEGFGLKPLYFGRIDMTFWEKRSHLIGLKMDFGYAQRQLPVQSGGIDSDYFAYNIVGDYCFSIVPSSKYLDRLNLYVMLGLYTNVLLSTSYSDDGSGLGYDFTDYQNRVSVGVQSGVGFGFEFNRFTLFIETSFAPAVTGDIKSVSSSLIEIDETSQYSFQLKIGAQFTIFGYDSGDDVDEVVEPSLTLNKRSMSKVRGNEKNK